MSQEAVKRLDWLAPTFGTCLRIHLGMDNLNTIRPSIAKGAFRAGGGLEGHKLKYGKAAKRMDRLAPNSEHVYGFIWEWT